MDQPKIERLLQLIMLMSSKTDYTIDDLSERLGTSPRSIYRYIETLRRSGFVIDKKKSNLYKLIKLPNSSLDFNKLIYFSEEEAYIINSLITSLDNTNLLKTALQKKLCAIYSLTSLTELITDKASETCITTLGDAIRTKKKVKLKGYESAHSQTITDRCVEPFAFSTNFIDIWAYDLEKNQNRVYKIARISEVEILEEAWEHEPEHRKAATDCFRMNGEEDIKVKMELSIRAKNLLIEEYPLAEKDIYHTHDTCIFESTVHSLEGVGRFVIGLAGEIRLIDSPALEEYVKEYIRKNMTLYITESET